MSRPLCLLLERDVVFALTRGGQREALRVPWNPDAPGPLVEALRAEFGAPAALVVIVGLAFLDIAEPQLPSVPNAVRLRMLQRESDRYFALNEPAAVACDGRVAFALSSALLASWIDALSAWCRVQAIVTVGEAAASGGRDGRWAVSAELGASGQLSIRDGQVLEARRIRGNRVDSERILTIAELADGAWRSAAGALDRQLLDVTMRDRMHRQRARRWWQSAMIAAAALGLLGWSVDRRHEQQLEALQREAVAMESATVGARAALERIVRANAEQTMIVESEYRAALPDAPPTVLAQLGTLLPRDAFLQRLEWNGTEWRIDGSANDAAALVPLLDADARFVNVRTAAPSTRYLENGHTRSSFSIMFQTVGIPATARAAR